MNIKKVSLSILIVFTLFILINKSVFSQGAIGVSPSELIVEVEQDSKTEQKFILNRSYTDDEFKFKIHLKEDSPYIELKEEEIILPDGVEEVEYKFFIDATQADLGEHKNMLYFCLIPPKEQKSQGVDINYCLGPKIIFTVVEPNDKVESDNKYYELVSRVEVKIILALFLIIVFSLIIFRIRKNTRAREH